MRDINISYFIVTTACVYLLRLTNKKIKITDDTIKNRMFVTALIVAHKWVEDIGYKNLDWCSVSGLTLSTINICEKQLFELLNYNICVFINDIDKVIDLLKTAKREFTWKGNGF